jgi:hypothetical protein
VRPFNFHLIATVAQLGHPTGSDPQRFALVAPFEKDPRRWYKLEWTNFYEPGSHYKIATPNRELHPDDQAEHLALKRARGVVIVKTFRDVLTEYRLHPEAKSLGPDEKPCDRTTFGLLRRRPVKIASVTRDGETISAITYIGKESNKLMEVASGLVTSPDDALNDYQDPAQNALWELARAVIDREPVERVAASASVSSSTVKNARAGKLTGKTARTVDVRAKLIGSAVERARAELRTRGAKVYGVTREALLATYLHAVAQEPSPGEPERLCACGCGQPIPAATRADSLANTSTTHIANERSALSRLTASCHGRRLRSYNARASAGRRLLLGQSSSALWRCDSQTGGIGMSPKRSPASLRRGKRMRS